MRDWMLLTIIFAVIMGVYYLFEKEAMKKDSYIEVLVFSITVCFIIILFDLPKAINIDPGNMGLIVLKSGIIFASWVLSFKSMSHMSVSKYGVINMSRILFTTILGVIVLHEVITLNEFIGMVIIVIGLLLVNSSRNKVKKKSKKYVWYLLLACVLMSIAGLLDKLICSNVSVEAFQFWFLLYLFIISWIYVLFRKIKIDFSSVTKNHWIYLYSIFYVIGDKILYTANGIDGSQISIISLLKQVSVIITVLVGGKIFKENNLQKKFLCSLIIFMGIIIVALY